MRLSDELVDHLLDNARFCEINNRTGIGIQLEVSGKHLEEIEKWYNDYKKFIKDKPIRKQRPSYTVGGLFDLCPLEFIKKVDRENKTDSAVVKFGYSFIEFDNETLHLTNDNYYYEQTIQQLKGQEGHAWDGYWKTIKQRRREWLSQADEQEIIFI